MHAAVIHFHTLEVYARSIYSCGMEPEVAKYHLGALALAVADSIASVSASFSPSGPGTAVMVLLSMEPGLPISVLATSIGLSHAGTVRLIDRLEREQLVERRRQITDRRARFIHLTNSGKKITDAFGKTSRVQTSRTRLWPNCTLLSYCPTTRVPCGTSKIRPVGLS